MTEPASCRRSREGLTEYLEDALSPTRRQGIERHLSECDECRKQLAQVRALIQVARGVPSDAMPPEMKTALLRALRERKES